MEGYPYLRYIVDMLLEDLFQSVAGKVKGIWQC